MTRCLIAVAFFLGSLAGYLGHIGTQHLDGITPLHAPVRAAQLEAELEDEREWGRRVLGYYHRAHHDLKWRRGQLYECRQRHCVPWPWEITSGMDEQGSGVYPITTTRGEFVVSWWLRITDKVKFKGR